MRSNREAIRNRTSHQQSTSHQFRKCAPERGWVYASSVGIYVTNAACKSSARYLDGRLFLVPVALLLVGVGQR
jgi:hypothetical protein